MIFVTSIGLTCFIHVIVLHLHNFKIPVHNKKEIELEKIQNLTWAFLPNSHNKKKITFGIYYTFRTTIFNYIKKVFSSSAIHLLILSIACPSFKISHQSIFAKLTLPKIIKNSKEELVHPTSWHNSHKCNTTNFSKAIINL